MRWIPALMLVMAFSAGGCTYGMWKAADSDLQYQDAEGNPAFTLTGDHRALVIKYEFSGEHSAVLVPLNDDGSPRPPFDFQVGKLHGVNFSFDVADAKRAAIVQSAAANAGAIPSGLSELLPDSQCCVRGTYSSPEWSEKQDPLVAVVYGVADNGQLVAVRRFDDPPSLADGRRVVALHAILVPKERPRSQASKDHDKRMAVLFTPVTVVADCGLYAVIIAGGVVCLPLQILMGAMH